MRSRALHPTYSAHWNIKLPTQHNMTPTYHAILCLFNSALLWLTDCSVHPGERWWNDCTCAYVCVIAVHLSQCGIFLLLPSLSLPQSPSLHELVVSLTKLSWTVSVCVEGRGSCKGQSLPVCWGRVLDWVSDGCMVSLGRMTFNFGLLHNWTSGTLLHGWMWCIWWLGC